MSDDEPGEGPDDPLAGLTHAKNDAIDRCHYKTACRLAREIKRAAKRERRLQEYAWSLHTLTNHARDLLDPEPGREAAVELIALLESEDRARQIQPDIDCGEYEQLVSWMSSCAYDNLGKLTAVKSGYNSEGLHEAIAEGIQVCRRTGKLECINCFREYASDVFRASDDVPMALHHARHVIAQGQVRPDFDRRWCGASAEAELLMVSGDIDAAMASARRAWELSGSFPHRLSARMTTANLLETIGLLQGSDEPISGLEGIAELKKSLPPEDEDPQSHMQRELVGAVRSSLRGDHAAAIQTLTSWDKRLSQRGCLEQWFEVRLRLIAAHRLAGDLKRVEALSGPLEEKAREARDWLTLRRLARLRDLSLPASPTAPVKAVAAGGGAAGAATAPEAAEAEPAAEAPGAADALPEGPPRTPLGPVLDELAARVDQAQEAGEPVAESLLDELIAIGPDAATHPLDVARMLALAAELADLAARGTALWNWARAIAAPFPQVPPVVNFLATLGDCLRTADDSQVASQIDAAEIEQLFRQSLDLDPNNPGNFGRAAVYHAKSGRMNEAERCLARCVRLDRTSAVAVLWLAEIYSESDRATDALAILDMALRAGSDDPEIAFRAAVLSHSLGQCQAMLTYLDQVEKVAPGHDWVNYYRASGLIALDRPAEGLSVIDEEERQCEGRPLHLLILRACAISALGWKEQFRALLDEILATRLSHVDYLSRTGLVQLFGRLWDAAKVLPDQDPLALRLAERLLQSGLAPSGVFEAERIQNPKAEGINFYVCSLIQPLDEGWREWPGCLHDEEDWTVYSIPWGVLAADPAQAAATAVAWQARCYPREAIVEEVMLEDDGYADHPGVVWQGNRSPRESPGESAEDD